MRSPIVIAVLIIFAVLHQDFWFWDDGTLVMGFMPVGLFYHALYSLVAATFWCLMVKYAWPSHIERWAEEDEHALTR